MGDRDSDGEGARPAGHLLFVEDDGRLASLTVEYLEKYGFSVVHVSTGETGLRRALDGSFDLVLLDIMLPGLSGIDFCRKLREHSAIPVIMITARGEEADRVLGLEIGADDYVSKPFSPRELMARVSAVLRRAKGRVGPGKETVTVGDLRLDPGAHSAVLAGRAIDLTPYEFRILLAMAERAGRVLSRDRLLDLARESDDEPFDRSIDVHISRIRHKLGDDPHSPTRIKTIRGAGYQYIDHHSP